MQESISAEKEKAHKQRGIFGGKTELYYAIISGVFFLTGLLLHFFGNVKETIPVYLYIGAYYFGGYFTLREAIRDIRKGGFEIDFLMLAAAIGAAYIGSWAEGALLLFLFSLGHALEHYAMNKAKTSIEALGNLAPKTALLKKGENLEEIAIEELRINDIIVIKPNSKISADGIIVKGHSSIDQSSITGESMPIDKFEFSGSTDDLEFTTIDAEHVVFTGTINGDGAIEVKVLKLSKDSTISRLIEMVSEVETHKSPTQRFAKKFEKWYVPAVIALVISLCFAYLVIEETYNESIYRAICVLVAASPCALAISTPSAVLSGVARAAKSGVLIKGGRALEELGSLTTIAFDKTGTLTEGKPKLTHAIPSHAIDKERFLSMVQDTETLSNHPLAKAISKGISEQFNIHNQNKANNIKAIQGMGLSAAYDGGIVFIGNEKLMEVNKIQVDAELKEKMEDLLKDGHTAMLVAYNNKHIGLLGVMDIPRESAKNTLLKLKEIGIKKMIMLTGDHQNVGDSIARQIGLTEAKGNLLPEDKVAVIQELKQRDTKIAMVGDGVNDAPAMANSTVGIAMGAAGSDVALETADVALMSDKIENLPFVIALSRKSKSIIKQNLWISMGVVALLIPATILDFANIGIAVVIHEGSTLVVVLNALRLLGFKMEE